MTATTGFERGGAASNVATAPPAGAERTPAERAIRIRREGGGVRRGRKHQQQQMQERPVLDLKISERGLPPWQGKTERQLKGGNPTLRRKGIEAVGRDNAGFKSEGKKGITEV